MAEPAAAAGKRFADEPVVGVVLGGVVVVLADLITWACAAVAAHGKQDSAAALVEMFPVIAALPSALLVAIVGLVARRPWIALGALIGLVVSVILLPGQCLVGVSAGWIRLGG